MNLPDAGQGNCLPIGYAVRGVEDQTPFDGVDGFDGSFGFHVTAAVLAGIGFKIYYRDFGVLLFLDHIQNRAMHAIHMIVEFVIPKVF